MSQKKSTKGRKMQDVHFSSVEEFLEYLPEDELRVVQRLRALVLDTLPGITEKLSFNVPFYRKHKTICFIWPGAVAWGGARQEGVRMGFANGHLLDNELNFLELGNRKTVAYHDFRKLSDIDEDIVKVYLQDAWELDLKEYQKKNRRK